MKLQIAALVLFTVGSFATSGQTVRALTLTSTETELQTAIAPQACSNCDLNSSTRASAKQFRPGREAQLKQHQDIRRQQEQRLQRNTQLRDQQIQRQETLRRQQERDYPQPEAIDRQQQEDARREWEAERDRQQQEDRDRRQQEELRREWEADRDRYYDPDDYDDHDDDRYDDYDNGHYDNDDDWRGDRYEYPDRRDRYQNSEDDWHSQEQERLEQQRQETVIRRSRERQTAWRDWEHQQNVLRWHWDTWQRTYRPSLVGTTSLEITSLDNNWSTVSIEGIDIAQEVSFTGSGVQTVYLSPGAYRIRFSPVLSEDSWHSGYLVVGRTNRLRIMFDQENESVQVLDDPQAWTVGDRLSGYPGN